MTQRYKEDILNELPEVDGLLGTGSYGDIATAIAEVMEKGEKPCHLGNIHTANQSGERILSTPRGMPICGSPRAATTTAPTA